MPIGGQRCPVSSELFAISADAHLLRGSLTPEECTCTFPDGRGASLPEARARLARVVCADPEQLGEGDIEAIAAAVEEAQIAAIAGALGRVAVPLPDGVGVIAVGAGAFLARAAVARTGLPLQREQGPLADGAGDVAAAVALSVLGGE